VCALEILETWENEIMKITIQVNSNRDLLLHKPIVRLNDDLPQPSGCSTGELLDYLRSAGVSAEEINRATREIDAGHPAIIESTKITAADLMQALEPEQDLGKALIREARRQFTL
jgi:hypothetical protein